MNHQLVIISGRSGSGKSTALHQLEDEGYYCIDNLPVSLLNALISELAREDFQHFQGTAVCIDARNAWRDLENFHSIMDTLPSDVRCEILFLDARDSTLIKRFSETRRRHPLSGEGLSLPEAIEQERRLLEPIASSASLVLDSSSMTIYELRDAIKERLLRESSGSMSVQIQSFGFKRGVPADADLVFDVRMLPNPHWVRELRMQTGLDEDVQAFLENQPETSQLLEDIRHYLERWLPRYQDSNRSYITVSLGCTGGQHRSVYLAQQLYQQLRAAYPQIHIRHRELQ
ncbi:MAG: RNase adapter RapZ [Pseudomonadota bacterium]